MLRSQTVQSRQLNPFLRLLISPCRSGSTALLNCLAQHPNVKAYYQVVKSGVRAGRGPDHRLFYLRCDPDQTPLLVDKETLGPHTPGEASLRVFPEDGAVQATRPLFLFRDPVQTWNGWVGQGWLQYDLFELAYCNAFHTFLYAKAVARPSVQCVTYEQLTCEPRRTLTELCCHWNLEYHPSMLNWQNTLQVRGPIRGGKDFRRSLAEGSFAVVQQTKTIQKIERPLVIADADIQRIVAGPLPAIYNQVQRWGNR